MSNSNLAKMDEKIKTKLDEWVAGKYDMLYWWEQDKTWFVVIRYATIIQFIRLFPIGIDQIALSADGSTNISDLADEVD